MSARILYVGLIAACSGVLGCTKYQCACVCEDMSGMQSVVNVGPICAPNYMEAAAIARDQLPCAGIGQHLTSDCLSTLELCTEVGLEPNPVR